jgi:hypothetical protein
MRAACFGRLDAAGRFRCLRTRVMEIDLVKRIARRLVARDNLAETTKESR